jgi:hypothetical protein|tara:strand:+ start:624 stop:845 length:222 start_codon:yes stop_codon:yes gene_type:complete
MTYELVSKTDGDVIFTVDLANVTKELARNYFTKVKKLDWKSFDELYEVREKKIKVPKDYQWWKEESTALDLEK